MNYTYEQAEELLTSQGKFQINLGLDRISEILKLLGNPQDNLQCIHVAGTNGKGSVCAIISSILIAAGKNVGLYSSPHLYKYTERIKLNGNNIADEDFAKYVFEISELAYKNNISLTEFEILTAIMFKYFFDKKVEIVVLETGLGGRFDATNVIKSNLCSIITHIDLDHTDRLGKTKDEIAFEKAGIIKPDCPVITSEGYEAIKDKADECNSLLLMVQPYENTDNLALKGYFQQENLSLAIAAVKLLFPEISEDIIKEGEKSVQHAGRFQFIEDKMILVDGAHNPNGALALRESLDNYFPDKKRRFIFGCLNTKDYIKMMDILFSKNDEIYFYHFNNKNSMTYQALQQACQYPSKEFHSFNEFEKDNETLTIICGSLYMIHELIQL